MKTFSLTIYSYILKYYNSLFDDLIKEYQISQIEIDILAFLANNPEYHYAQEIVDVRGISKAHVSIAVEKLVKRGFLNRETDPKNRRCNILKITDEASELITKIQDVQSYYTKQVYQGMSKKDKENFNYYLSKMYQNIGGKINE